MATEAMGEAKNRSSAPSTVAAKTGAARPRTRVIFTMLLQVRDMVGPHSGPEGNGQESEGGLSPVLADEFSFVVATAGCQHSSLA